MRTHLRTALKGALVLALVAPAVLLFTGGLSAADIPGIAVVAFAAFALLRYDPSATYATLAMGAPIAERTVATTDSTFRVRDVSDAVTVMDIADQVPLDQMLRRARRRKPAKGIKIEFPFRDATPPRRDIVTANAAAGAAGAAVVLTVGAVGQWRPNDQVVIPSSIKTAPVLLVTVVNIGAGTITVVALPEATSASADIRTPLSLGTVPAINSGTSIFRIANSKTEKDAPSQSRTTTGSMDFNYIHTYDALVSASDHMMRTETYGMESWMNDKPTNVADLRRSMEYNGFFGRRSVSVGANGQLRWTMAGVTRFINQQFDYTAASLSESTIVDLTTAVFTGTNGSRSRVLFVDSVLNADLAKVQLAKMHTPADRNVLGVETTELRAGGGKKLLVVHHPLFDDMGLVRYGVALDMREIAKAEMKPLHKTEIDHRTNGDADGESEQWGEKSTLEMRRANAHWLIRGT